MSWSNRKKAKTVLSFFLIATISMFGSPLLIAALSPQTIVATTNLVVVNGSGKLQNYDGSTAINLASLDDIQTIGLLDNQVLGYNETSGLWQNINVTATGGGNSYSYGNLTDASFVVLANGDIPTYNSTSGKWNNQQPFSLSWNTTVNQLISLSAIATTQITSLNATIDNRISIASILWNQIASANTTVNALINAFMSSTTVYVNSTSVTTFTVENGTLASLLYADFNTYGLTEGTGSANYFYMNYTGVTTFGEWIIREYYTGTSAHHIDFQIYNTATSAWDTQTQIAGQPSYQIETLAIYNSTDYISSGVVRTRLYHEENGVASHHLYLDYAWLLNGSNIAASTNLVGYAQYNSGYNNYLGYGNMTMNNYDSTQPIGAYSYLIYQSPDFGTDGLYMAKAANGTIAFTSTNGATVTQSAVNTLTVGGTIVLACMIPIDNDLNINYPNITVSGMGWNTGFYQTVGARLITVGNDTGSAIQGVDNFRLTNMALNLEGAANGIWIYGNGAIIQNVKFFNPSPHPAWVMTWQNNNVMNDTAEASQWTNNHQGISFYGNNTQVSGCQFINMYAYAIWSIHNVAYMIINTGARIENNYFESNIWNAIALYNSENFAVIGNAINGSTHSGIAFSPARHGVVTGNTVWNVPYNSHSGVDLEAGIELEASHSVAYSNQTFDISVTGNVIHDSWIGIKFGYSAVNNVLITNVTASANTISSCIKGISVATGCIGVQLNGNSIFGCGTSIVDTGSYTIINAIIKTVTVNEVVSAGDLLFQNSTGYFLANAVSATRMNAVVMATQATTANNLCLVMETGYFNNPSWGLTVGGSLYVSNSTNGALIQTLPATSGNIDQYVGRATSATQIFFAPNMITIGR